LSMQQRTRDSSSFPLGASFGSRAHPTLAVAGGSKNVASSAKTNQRLVV
jgi:hypothetical protein